MSINSRKMAELPLATHFRVAEAVISTKNPNELRLESLEKLFIVFFSATDGRLRLGKRRTIQEEEQIRKCHSWS